ncbi:MAG TPA: acetyl-CoA carboxylase biotin carboxyl carrier protein [Victivallales bacterium]|nr:acetyl-CoA carboxylase biotin carboxyl carrier protein [Victivallales bacterium]HPO91013.1 acetyl-CoA carboxylase biotin carboxyl carrier protein [Victivallales bacterium]HRR05793.1 acetyl-CoA carboxylase biotin carboxyl carrier protein [Victivallales bacterium]HRR28291.1 acetyl-CoA carboxylase biotin carboxyl carrier protein [Victivallales bacterium]HRU02033.1 acetyl-CoA carboxylase biotin carboxyl carrier protein [Victivallales bacterium]
MDIDKIKQIVEMMSEHDISEFKIESKDSNLCIKRGSGIPIIQHHVSPPPTLAVPSSQPQVQQASPKTPEPTQNAPQPAKRNTIDAPIVGTFYRAPSPEAPPFVKEGDKVTPDTVVCIIEAMKVMNEIKAEKSGIIKEILVENAKPVEYGQPLMVIE